MCSSDLETCPYSCSPAMQHAATVDCFLQVGLLLLVAGYQHLDKLGSLDAQGLRQHFEVNSIGPILVAQALRPNLGSGSKARSSPAVGLRRHYCERSIRFGENEL
jgi:NAD(P)-dependent dehydrogenase (short-subunit alcohol dehydrogenase family)